MAGRGTFGRGTAHRRMCMLQAIYDEPGRDTLMSYGKTVREELRRPTRELRHAIPRVYAGYKELHDAALAPGALDTRTKELIALAIAVSKECDGCIAAHAHAAVQHGATLEEAAEVMGVTFLMNGGPATIYGARAFDAFREFYVEHAAVKTDRRQSAETALAPPRQTGLSVVLQRGYRRAWPIQLARR